MLYAENLVLSTDAGTQLIDKLRDFLTKTLTEELSKGKEGADRTLLDSLWRILIIGWHLFARTTSLQYSLFSLILSQSTSPIYTSPSPVQVPTQLLADQTVAAKSTAEPMSAPLNYYVKLLETSLTPLALFHLRFYHYHAAFFPLEMLLQSRVKTFLVLVDRSSFPDATTYSHFEQ